VFVTDSVQVHSGSLKHAQSQTQPSDWNVFLSACVGTSTTAEQC